MKPLIEYPYPIVRAVEFVQHPIEHIKWWKWQLTKNTICKWFGHKQDHIDHIIGCCGRCYGTLPQSEEQAEVFREAMMQAWEHAEENLNNHGTGK